MAFLCPVRIRSQKSKKKKELDPIIQDNEKEESFPGRITGSSSIETLVRVGLEKGPIENKQFQVLHDFSPCVDDELEVKRGDVVSLLYREHDWAYVVNGDKEGFIPFSYLTEFSDGDGVECFYKDTSYGRYIVLYTFIARDENDLSVERGELVTVLNKDDPDWFWVIGKNQMEGFVPSAFVFPFSYIKDGGSSAQSVSVSEEDKKGSEMILLYDYKAQAPDDLSVRRGDWVYAEMSQQTVEGWLWAFSPKQKKFGFIPKAYARPPAMTSL